MPPSQTKQIKKKQPFVLFCPDTGTAKNPQKEKKVKQLCHVISVLSGPIWPRVSKWHILFPSVKWRSDGEAVGYSTESPSVYQSSIRSSASSAEWAARDIELSDPSLCVHIHISPRGCAIRGEGERERPCPWTPCRVVELKHRLHLKSSPPHTGSHAPPQPPQTHTPTHTHTHTHAHTHKQTLWPAAWLDDFSEKLLSMRGLRMSIQFAICKYLHCPFSLPHRFASVFGHPLLCWYQQSFSLFFVLFWTEKVTMSLEKHHQLS